MALERVLTGRHIDGMRSNPRWIPRLTPVLAGFLAVGCSPFLDGDGSAARFREQTMRYLAVSANSSITSRDGVEYLSTRVSATNTGYQAIRASEMGEPWLIRIYGSPDRRGTPLWRTEDLNYAFQPVPRPFVIAPGETVNAETYPERVDRVLKGAPPGTYYVAVALRVGNPYVTTGEWPAGEITR